MFALGNFANRQRERHRAGVLSDERYEKLVEIGFEFEHDQEPWAERFQQLVDFYREQGHFEVPGTSQALQRWVVVQRDHYRRNCKLITGYRVLNLKAIGFDWEPRQATSGEGIKSRPSLHEKEECVTLDLEPVSKSL
jgi:hypothetical protein